MRRLFQECGVVENHAIAAEKLNKKRTENSHHIWQHADCHMSNLYGIGWGMSGKWGNKDSEYR